MMYSSEYFLGLCYVMLCLPIMLLRHKRDIDSAIPFSSPEINSMLKVKSDNAMVPANYHAVIHKIHNSAFTNL